MLSYQLVFENAGLRIHHIVLLFTRLKEKKNWN